MAMTYDGMILEVPASYHFTLRYDGCFFVHLYENTPLTLPEMLDNVKADFHCIPTFERCDLIDADTGEVLFEVYRP